MHACMRCVYARAHYPRNGFLFHAACIQHSTVLCMQSCVHKRAFDCVNVCVRVYGGMYACMHASRVNACYKWTFAYVNVCICMCVCVDVYAAVCVCYTFVHTLVFSRHACMRLYICILPYVRFPESMSITLFGRVRLSMPHCR